MYQFTCDACGEEFGASEHDHASSTEFAFILWRHAGMHALGQEDVGSFAIKWVDD